MKMQIFEQMRKNYNNWQKVIHSFMRFGHKTTKSALLGHFLTIFNC